MGYVEPAICKQAPSTSTQAQGAGLEPAGWVFGAYRFSILAITSLQKFGLNPARSGQKSGRIQHQRRCKEK
jgi:hypothetical protein